MKVLLGDSLRRLRHPGGDYPPSKKALLKMIFLFPRWDMLVPWRVLHENILENTVHFDSNYIVALFFIILSHQATFIFNKDHGRWNREIDISYRCRDV